MKVFNPISTWRVAGLIDKSNAYFKSKTPENENRLLMASAKTCSRLFSGIGKQGMVLAQDKNLFDKATNAIFNLAKDSNGFCGADGFAKGCICIGFASTLISFGIYLLSEPQNFWKMSESGSVGKTFFIITIVSSFTGFMPAYSQSFSRRKDEVISSFEDVVGPAYLKLMESLAKANNVAR